MTDRREGVDYEIDYDDDGNEIRTKITKTMLAERLAASEARASKYAREAGTASREVMDLKRTIENASKWRAIGEAIGPGYVIPAQADFQPIVSTREIHGFGLTSVVEVLPSDAVLRVEFHGDLDALARFGDALMKGWSR